MPTQSVETVAISTRNIGGEQKPQQTGVEVNGKSTREPPRRPVQSSAPHPSDHGGPKPSVVPSFGWEDETINTIMDGLARMAAENMAKEYGIDQATAYSIVKGLLAERDVLEEFYSGAYRVAQLLQGLRVGRISEKQADLEMGRLIATLSDVIRKKIQKQYYDDDTEDMKEVYRLAKKLMTYRAVLDSVLMPRHNNDDDIMKLIITLMQQQTQIMNTIIAALLVINKSSPEVEEIKKQLEQLNTILEKKKEDEERRKLVHEIIEKEIKPLQDKLSDVENKLKGELGDISRRLEQIVEAISKGNVQQVKEVASETISSLKSLESLLKEVEEAKKLLQTLGWEVKSPSEAKSESQKETIEDKKLNMLDRFINQYIGPAIKEILSNPEKIVKVLGEARKIAEVSAGTEMGSMPKIDEEMPKI